jgi:hypothetical protein
MLCEIRGKYNRFNELEIIWSINRSIKNEKYKSKSIKCSKFGWNRIKIKKYFIGYLLIFILKWNKKLKRENIFIHMVRNRSK